MVGGVAPGSSSRGRGGKFKKYTRGGGKHFSRDLQPVDADGNHVSMWSADAQKNPGEEDDEDESSEEEESSEDDDEAGKPKGDATREDRKALKKARKQAAISRQKGQTVEVGDMPSSEEESEEDEDMPANPNHSKAARNQIKAAVQGEDGDEAAEGTPKAPASRKERESAEAAAAKEKYMKLHTQGKTDEAKADLARLKLIREQRDAEAARRQAEKEDRDAQEKARKAEADAKEAKKREAAAGPKKPIKKK